MTKFKNHEVEFEDLSVYEKIIYLFSEIDIINSKIFIEIDSKQEYYSLDDNDIARRAGYEEEISIIEEQMPDLINSLFRYSHDNNLYYFDCSSKVYISHFGERQKEYQNKLIEVTELDFLLSEIEYFKSPVTNRLFENKYNYDTYIKYSEQCKVSLRHKLDYLKPKLLHYNYDLIITEDSYVIDSFFDGGVMGTRIEVNKLNSKVVNPIILKSKQKSKYPSFTYKKWQFESTNLTYLKESLIDKKLIASDTELKHFRKAFSGEEIEKPIVWTGTISELTYFIKQLHNILKYVENVKLEIWAVTINCFIQENGEQYNRTKLRTQKVPATSKNIDKALKTLQ